MLLVVMEGRMFRKLIIFSLAIVITLSCGILSRAPENTISEEQTNEKPNFLPTPTEPGGTDLPKNTSEAPTDLPAQEPALTLGNLNLIPPDNIIQEISFFGSLGGCGRGCQCSDIDYDNPTVYVSNDTVEVFNYIFFEICQPFYSEEINITIELPNGKKRNFTHTGSDGIEYVPLLHDPLGQYIFTFSGSGWEYEDERYSRGIPHNLIGWKEYTVNKKVRRS
jgi:hypothetical protein